MSFSLPHAVPPRLPQAGGPDADRVRLRTLLPLAGLVAAVGWIGIQGAPTFFSPGPLASLWIYFLLESLPILDRARPVMPILVGIVHGLFFLVWTWPALRWSPLKIPLTFLIALGLLAAANSLYIVVLLAWTLIPVGLVPIALLVQGIIHRKETDPSLLAWYYALVFAWIAFGAFSWPPGVWI